MRHAILGHGNLGESIIQHITKHEHDEVTVIECFAKPDFEYPFKGTQEVVDFNPDVIWNCVGVGSVDEGNKFFDYQIQVAIGMANWQMTTFPKAKHVIFTTDYASYRQSPHEIKSRYGVVKMMMESLVQYISKNDGVAVCVYRVCNLYGAKHMSKNLVFKLAKSIDTNEKIKVPSNQVCMSNTDWLAACVYPMSMAVFKKSNRNFSKFFVAPTNNTISIYELARAVARAMNKDASVVELGSVDESRPESPLPGKLDYQLTKGNHLHEPIDSMVKKIVKYYFMSKTVH